MKFYEICPHKTVFSLAVGGRSSRSAVASGSESHQHLRPFSTPTQSIFDLSLLVLEIADAIFVVGFGC